MKSMLIGLVSGVATHWWQTSSLVPERVRPPLYGEAGGVDAWAWDLLRAFQESVQSGDMFLAILVALMVMLVWPGIEYVLRRLGAFMLSRHRARVG